MLEMGPKNIHTRSSIEIASKQGDALVDLLDGRVVPFRDLTEVDVGQYVGCEIQGRLAVEFL